MILTRLDRLTWRNRLSFSSFGACMGIRTNDASALGAIRADLPPYWQPVEWDLVEDIYSLWLAPGSTKVPCRLYAGNECVARVRDRQQAIAQLRSLLHFNVAVKARGKLFVHAGVVGWLGRAIVIPGRSMTGKTSLVAALVRAGAEYLSDEYAVFDEAGRVHPYPKPLSIRPVRGGGLPEWTPAESLGGVAGTAPLPVGLVVVTAYQEDGQWLPVAMSPAEALVGLIENTVMVREQPEAALASLSRAIGPAKAIRSPRGNAGDIVTELLSM